MRHHKRPAAKGAAVVGPGEDAEVGGAQVGLAMENRKRFTDECVGHGRSGIHRFQPG